MKQKPEEPSDTIGTDASEIEGLISRVKTRTLSDRDAVVLERLLRLVLALTSLLERKNASIKLLKKLLFGPRSEKSSSSSPLAPAPSSASSSPPPLGDGWRR